MIIIPDNPGIIAQFAIKTEDGWNHTFLDNGFIEPDGTCVEIEYQAAKPADSEVAALIMACKKPFGPNGAKKLGRSCVPRADWEYVKYQVMTHYVFAKFTDHLTLAKMLLSTGYALLVEGNNWHDNTWGDCHCGRPECQQVGWNWLGHILMCAREMLRTK